MNVYAVTYSFNGEFKTLIVESNEDTLGGVKNSLHPAIFNKVTDIEFVGSLA